MSKFFSFIFHEENEIADICTNVLVFLQEENEIADICTSFMVLS